MFEKNGKFYADWRDRSGRRLRKSFTSARAALRFEEEQRELAHPKSKAQGRRLPKSSAPKTGANLQRGQQTPSSRPSSPLRVISRPKKSAPLSWPK